MAAPVINSVTPSPLELQPGETKRITIDASDPDANSGNVTVRAVDANGDVTEVLLPAVISDPLTYQVEDTDALGLTITQVAGFPNQFDVTAPAG